MIYIGYIVGIVAVSGVVYFVYRVLKEGATWWDL